MCYLWPQENTDINNQRSLVIDIVTSQAFTSEQYINIQLCINKVNLEIMIRL